ncbi:hypothetical protein [Niallia circulans]|uniref:hypothetical protein n=1 Tax=Niallia circulans TaxID=1397 RepID=UPI0026ED68CA|nr:hypothetical protein [Niallia circulans]
MNLEDLIDELLTKKEEEAWNKVKDKMTSTEFPDVVNFATEKAYKLGYAQGSIDKQDELLELSKNDPNSFFNWIKKK